MQLDRHQHIALVVVVVAAVAATIVVGVGYRGGWWHGEHVEHPVLPPCGSSLGFELWQRAADRRNGSRRTVGPIQQLPHGTPTNLVVACWLPHSSGSCSELVCYLSDCWGYRTVVFFVCWGRNICSRYL